MVSAGGVASRQTLLLTTLQACRPPGRQPESSAAKGSCAEGRRDARSNTCSQPVMVATITVVVLATRMQRVSSSARAFRLASTSSSAFSATWLPPASKTATSHGLAAYSFKKRVASSSLTTTPLLYSFLSLRDKNRGGITGAAILAYAKIMTAAIDLASAAVYFRRK